MNVCLKIVRLMIPLPIRLMCKARKINSEIEKLQRIKEDDHRVRSGLPKKLSKLETFLAAIFNFIRAAILVPCCPCFNYDFGRNEDTTKRPNFFRRFFLDGKIENRVLKAFLGFFCGVALSLGLFTFLVYTVHVPVVPATYSSATVGCFCSFGLAFSQDLRCLFFLILPQFASKRGRSILMAYIYILVFTGPFRNLTSNVKVMSNSLICQQDMIRNRTAEILRTAFSPVLDFMESIRRVLDALVLFARLVKEAFKAFLDLFKEIARAIRKAFGWLSSVMNACPKLMDAPEKACWKYLMEKKRKCDDFVVFTFLCELVTGFAKTVCPLLKIAKQACIKLHEFYEDKIKPLEERFEAFCDRMFEGFYVNVTTYTYFNYSLEQTQTLGDIAKEMTAEIEDRLAIFEFSLDLSGLFLSFGFIWLVLKAIFYLWRYRTSEKYDNIYVTWLVRDIDSRRWKADRETILPLARKQKRKYITPFSLKLSRTERRKMTFASMFFIVSLIQIGYYILLDYLLFWILDRIAAHGKINVKLQVPFTVDLKVEGDGLLADMYRDIADIFNPLLMEAPAADNTKCLPNPNIPNFKTYKLIGILLLLYMFLTLLGAYALRLRHMICACYYPEQERRRAIWLFNHILQTRTGYLKHLYRMVKRNYRDGQEQYKFRIAEATIVEYLAHKSKLLLKLFRCLGYQKVICLGCKASGSTDDTVNFKKCPNLTCDAIYCNDCYAEMDNMCTVCLSPVQYGDTSDVSEEVDSSDDEMQKVQNANSEAKSLRYRSGRNDMQIQVKVGEPNTKDTAN